MSVADSQGIAERTPSFAGVFPLPLSTFEFFMFADTRSDYPMMCDLELHFEGCIDRSAFDAGLALAMARNPLFRALVAGDDRGPLIWELTDRVPQVDWAPLGTPLGSRYDEFVDLRTDIGLRIWVARGSIARPCCCTFIMPAPTAWEESRSSKIFSSAMRRHFQGQRQSRLARSIRGGLRGERILASTSARGTAKWRTG